MQSIYLPFNGSAEAAVSFQRYVYCYMDSKEKDEKRCGGIE